VYSRKSRGISEFEKQIGANKNMKNISSLAMGFLVFLMLACSTALSDSPRGLLADRVDRIDRGIEASIADGEIPGAVAVVARDGKTLYHKAFGYADIDSEIPMQTGTIFRIASMTKAITSVGVMILYEHGHFRLNDPIANFIPEFAEMSVVSEVSEEGDVVATLPAKNPIRIIDLLTHSSGISYPFIANDLQKTYVDAGVIDGLTEKDTLLENQMKLLARQPLLFEPGAKFLYGLNTDLLGYLIEVVSGVPLDEFFASHITDPLKMYDTHFYLPESKASRLATLYAWFNGEGLIVSRGDESEIKLDNPNYPIEGAKTMFSGGAGLSSTASDYARFIQMLANEGQLDGERILSRKSVELMRTPRIDWDDDGDADFGLGFAVINDLGQYGELGTVGTYSWGGAFETSYWIDPGEGLIAVLMTQSRPSNSSLEQHFKTLVYQALE